MSTDDQLLSSGNIWQYMAISCNQPGFELQMLIELGFKSPSPAKVESMMHFPMRDICEEQD